MKQRQIKFRVWDVENKKFVDEDPFYSKWAVSLDGRPYHGKYDHRYSEDECIVQQFTGMFDKNGKEIYEGDIVRFNRWNCPIPSPNIEDYLVNGYKKIVYGLDYGQHPTAGFCAINLQPADLENGYQLNHMDSRNMQVIGNIFEDGDLLQS